MKRNAIARIVIYSLIVVILVGVLGLVAGGLEKLDLNLKRGI
jgi:hypothetical protein